MALVLARAWTGDTESLASGPGSRAAPLCLGRCMGGRCGTCFGEKSRGELGRGHCGEGRGPARDEVLPSVYLGDSGLPGLPGLPEEGERPAVVEVPGDRARRETGLAG